MQRMYEVSEVRDNMSVLNPVTEFEPLIVPQVVKTWTWNRDYIVKYDLTQALKLDYQGTAQALILEDAGLIPSEIDDPDNYNRYREEVQNSLMQGGEVTTYNHQVNGSYKLPLNKFPLTDWLSADTRYQSSYRWDRRPFAQDSLGNTIQNSRNVSLNAQANFKNFYNKVPFFKEINNKRRPVQVTEKSATKTRWLWQHRGRRGEGENRTEHRGTHPALRHGPPQCERNLCPKRRNHVAGVPAHGFVCWL